MATSFPYQKHIWVHAWHDQTNGIRMLLPRIGDGELHVNENRWGHWSDSKWCWSKVIDTNLAPMVTAFLRWGRAILRMVREFECWWERVSHKIISKVEDWQDTDEINFSVNSQLVREGLHVNETSWVTSVIDSNWWLWRIFYLFYFFAVSTSAWSASNLYKCCLSTGGGDAGTDRCVALVASQHVHELPVDGELIGNETGVAVDELHQQVLVILRGQLQVSVFEGLVFDEAPCRVHGAIPFGSSPARADHDVDCAIKLTRVIVFLVAHAAVLVNRARALIIVHVTVDREIHFVLLPEGLQILTCHRLSKGAQGLVTDRGGVSQGSVSKEDQPWLLLPVGARHTVLQEFVLLGADSPVHFRIRNAELELPPACRIPVWVTKSHGWSRLSIWKLVAKLPTHHQNHPSFFFPMIRTSSEEFRTYPFGTWGGVLFCDLGRGWLPQEKKSALSPDLNHHVWRVERRGHQNGYNVQ